MLVFVAECGTDHSLVQVEIAQRIATLKRKEERGNADVNNGKLKVREFYLNLENRF